MSDVEAVLIVNGLPIRKLTDEEIVEFRKRYMALYVGFPEIESDPQPDVIAGKKE